MPIDAMFIEPMLGPFRAMLAEVEQKGLAGSDVEEMRAQLGVMETLAREMSDIAAYSGRLAQDLRFQKFSDAYSRALSNAARAAATAAPNGDDALLGQTLKAYEDALHTYRTGQAGAEAQLLIPVLDQILALGRSGVSYPVFLRQLEEQHLTRALEGSAPVARAGLLKELEFAQAQWLRWESARAHELLAAFDAAAASAPFGQPDPFEFSLMRKRVEWNYAPYVRYWDAKIRRWQHLLDLLFDWADSFCSFAFYDDRWRGPGDTDASVRRNIARTQETTPGVFAFHEALFTRYFGVTWHALFQDETVIWEYSANRVFMTDERLQVICDTYVPCKAHAAPHETLISRAEELHRAKRCLRNSSQTPPWGTPLRAVPVILA